MDGAWAQYAGDNAVHRRPGQAKLPSDKAAASTTSPSQRRLRRGDRPKLDGAGVKYRATGSAAPNRRVFLRDPNGVNIELNANRAVAAAGGRGRAAGA